MSTRWRFPAVVLAVTLVSTLALGDAGLPSTGFREIRLPARPGAGAGLEETVLLDTDATKLVAITLRRGAELSQRSYASSVTIQALQGNGTVTFADGESVKIGPGKMLALTGKKRHSIRPGVYGYLVLLVQHAKTTRTQAP